MVIIKIENVIYGEYFIQYTVRKVNTFDKIVVISCKTNRCFNNRVIVRKTNYREIVNLRTIKRSCIIKKGE